MSFFPEEVLYKHRSVFFCSKADLIISTGIPEMDEKPELEI
ncbi:hypothetical protein [Methanosarcina mazei]|nr:hypothetical protein [Methanosarcina mazei]